MSLDCVYTPSWAARDMVEFFSPRGRILEPCSGKGALLDLLPGAEWCEIEQGKDFFDWQEPVDWIVTNPPYSKNRKFLLRSFDLADNVVFLIPPWKFFSVYGLVRRARQFGGTKHIRWYGTGSKLGFPMGNAIGAVHWERDYRGGCSESFYEDDKSSTTRI